MWRIYCMHAQSFWCDGQVVEGSRLPLGVLEFALLWTLWRLGAQCDSGCSVCCSMRDHWLLHLTLLLLLHGLMVIYFSLWTMCFLILWLSVMFATVLLFVFVAFMFWFVSALSSGKALHKLNLLLCTHTYIHTVYIRDEKIPWFARCIGKKVNNAKH